MVAWFKGLRRTFLINALAMAFLTAAVAGIGVWSARNLATAIHASQVSSAALRNHMSADMMHDALRGDVLAAIEAGGNGTAEAKKQVETDLAEHVATFKESVETNTKLDLPADIVALLDRLHDPLAQYISSAQATVAAALADPAAGRARLPDFLKAFSELEEAMEQASEAIEAGVEKSADEDAKLAVFAEHLMEIGFVVGLLVSLFLNFMIGRSIIPPISAMTTAMTELAAGNTNVTVPSQQRRDEIGAMAGAVEVFKQNALLVKQHEAQQKEQEARSREEKRALMNQLADQFEADVLGVVQTVSASAQQLEQNAGSMSASAEETAQQSTAVAAAAEQATGNVGTVAAAAEELSKSIGEISQQVTSASRISSVAIEQATKTLDVVRSLDASAKRIGEVVSLIGNVSEQTNLLALNATIEAARAGDAGKGFAVVAQEVKQLASQTSRATEEIASQIEAVQKATNEVVAAMSEINKSITDMDSVSGAIAAAIEEQGAATQEIARNVTQALTGTQEVSSNISGVSQAAHQTGTVSGDIMQAAVALTRHASALRGQVGSFIERVRAA